MGNKLKLLWLVFLLVAVPAQAQTVITPVAGVATVDTSTCPGPGTPCAFQITMTGGVTLNLINGRGTVDLFFTNTGAFTLTWPATVVSPPTVASSATTLVSLKFNNTLGQWYVTSGGGTGSGGGVTLPAGVDTGVVNAYVVNTSPAVTLTTGASFSWTTTHPNTGASTINVSGTGVIALTYGYFDNQGTQGHALIGGEIVAGVTYVAFYDGVRWVLPNISPGVAGTTRSTLDLTHGLDLPSDRGITLTSRALDSVDVSRGLLVFNCAGKNIGCTNGQSAQWGFDGDGVYVLSVGGGSRLGLLQGTNTEVFSSFVILGDNSTNNFLLAVDDSGSGNHTASGDDFSVKDRNGILDLEVDVNGGTLAYGNPLMRYQCTNVTPVTVNANTTADQNLQSCTIPAGAIRGLSAIGRTLTIQLAGVYSTPAASTTAVNIKVKLCSVSGCGSGNVATLLNITSAALAGIQATNDPFNLNATVTTQTAGVSSAAEAHGNLTIDISALSTAAESVFADNNTATISGSPSAVDLTAQTFLQFTASFTVASASNSITQRQTTVSSVN